MCHRACAMLVTRLAEYNRQLRASTSFLSRLAGDCMLASQFHYIHLKAVQAVSRPTPPGRSVLPPSPTSLLRFHHNPLLPRSPSLWIIHGFLPRAAALALFITSTATSPTFTALLPQTGLPPPTVLCPCPLGLQGFLAMGIYSVPAAVSRLRATAPSLKVRLARPVKRVGLLTSCLPSLMQSNAN